MNAFEELVAGLLRREGIWTHAGYRVNLSKGEKAEIGTPSMPRPEIDILGFRPTSNELLWIECKSYLDSPGVSHTDLVAGGKHASRYKVFTNPKLRLIAGGRLCEQAVSRDSCAGTQSLDFG